MAWFSTIFTARLFNDYPLSKALFSQTRKGASLVLSSTIDQIEDENSFQQAIAALAQRHSVCGVKLTKYRIVGDVLSWSIKFFIGAAANTPAAETAWIKFYFKILEVALPSAVPAT